MRITFKLYAMLSDHLPDEARKTNSIELDLPNGRTVGQVIDEFNLPPKLVHLVLVNGNYIQPAERAGRTLAEGDMLAIWPPIAGG
ncbi:MAG: MoaD/ThiS family protein [Betaproteobacteria bacterium]|nr:MoaD/ThiS family protein [Betaproteobacteria bacterium]